MNPIFYLTALLQLGKDKEKAVTCPNCGQKQVKKAELEFSCEFCQYKTQTHVRPAKLVSFFTPGRLYEIVFLLLGPVFALIGLKGFLISNGLIDGGVTGISMLCSRVTGLELAIFVVLINIPFIVASYYYFNREFAVRASLSIVLLAILLPLVKIDSFTNDRLLDAVFGGFFLGSGIAFSIRGGGVLDGTEILALIISRRFPATVGDAILFFNIIIFSAALLILQPEQVLYSILTYFSASKTVDFMMHGIESYNGVFIFSGFSQQIRFALVNDLGRGATMIKSRGGYSEKDQEILFVVLTRLEIGTMKSIIESVDPGAFVVTFPISDVRGGVIKKVLFEKKI